MDLFFIGLTLSLFGKLAIALAVLSAHSTLTHEHKIDELVLKGFRREKIITIIGIVLLVFGYLCEVQFFGGFEYLLTCEGEACILGGE